MEKEDAYVLLFLKIMVGRNEECLRLEFIKTLQNSLVNPQFLAWRSRMLLESVSSKTKHYVLLCDASDSTMRSLHFLLFVGAVNTHHASPFKPLSA